MGAAFISILTVALVAGLYYLIIGKLVRGLRCFSRFAGQWKSEDEQKVNIMESLGLVSGGLASRRSRVRASHSAQWLRAMKIN